MGRRVSSASFDYETSTNPFVAVTQHLEATGWVRIDQHLDGPAKDVKFEKPGEGWVHVLFTEDGTYTRTVYTHTPAEP